MEWPDSDIFPSDDSGAGVVLVGKQWKIWKEGRCGRFGRLKDLEGRQFWREGRFGMKVDSEERLEASLGDLLSFFQRKEGSTILVEMSSYSDI